MALPLLAAVDCGGKAATPTPPGGAPQTPALAISGDPESTAGATWTYRAADAGVTYDLQGILLKPRGSGPFPAVILSHGYGGNAAGYPRGLGAEMVSWGLVCIATNYTHAAGVPIGAPGGTGEPGASGSNVLRAHKVRQILEGLGYVDVNRIAAHGHSMGAYLTAALVGAYPSDVRVASHTAGGVRPDGVAGQTAAPSESQAAPIRVPYQMHHGDADTTVPLSFDQRLQSLLLGRGVPHELHVYAGLGHDIARNAEVAARVRDWYARYGMF